MSLGKWHYYKKILKSVGCVKGTERVICTESRQARKILTASSFGSKLLCNLLPC